jgi:phenylalanyl-tRNA synthetase beta chain
MPKIEISKRELEKLIGREFSIKELDELLLFAKGELENVDDDILKVDIKDTNRPDLWSIEGIAREIKLHLGIKTEIKYKNSKVEVIVDEKTSKVRPYIACCIVKGLNFTDELIKEVMEQQEKLHLLLGRDREKIAIGISNFDLITPNITYKLATEKIKFAPLGYEEEMTPKEILRKHEKGIKYRHLVKKAIPILVDSKEEVISMPPIINSNKLGKITTETKNIFIDVTGTDKKLVELTLLILALNFAERNGKIERVKVKYKNKEIFYPILEKKSIKINPENVRKILGLNLSNKGIVDLLKKAGYECSMKGDKIECIYPPYRYDIIDERDVIEDVAISYGYNDIEPLNLEIFTIGEENKKEKYCKVVEELMIGLGFQQILSFILSSEDNEIKKMKVKTNVCRIVNPCSQSYTIVRSSLLPSLLNFLSKNQHVDFPQKIFEVGRVVENSKEKILLSAMISNSIVGYEEISSVLDTLLSNLKISYKLKKTSDPRFIGGRVAKIIVNNREVGIMGEISPEVLENFKLETLVVGFELDLEFLF